MVKKKKKKSKEHTRMIITKRNKSMTSKFAQMIMIRTNKLYDYEIYSVFLKDFGIEGYNRLYALCLHSVKAYLITLLNEYVS